MIFTIRNISTSQHLLLIAKTNVERGGLGAHRERRSACARPYAPAVAADGDGAGAGGGFLNLLNSCNQ
jgi:hypothetical protein